MGNFMDALFTGQTWVYAIAFTAVIIGLAKAWMQFKSKCAEKCSEQEATQGK